MALTDKLSAIADAIRLKTGRSASLTLDQFASEIEGITVGLGRDPIIEPLVITENGTYTSSDTVDGYSPVTVQINDNYTLLDSILDGTITEYNDSVITKVGDLAFYQVKSLVSVDLPSVTEVGESSFKDCTSLSSINLPLANRIYPSAFSGCESLVSIDLPSVTTLPGYAFYGCTSLTNINLPNVTSLGAQYEPPFYGCNNLTSLSLPKVTEFNYYVFSNSGITSLYAPNLVTVGYASFAASMFTTLTLPLVTTVGTEAFYMSQELTYLDLPSVEDLGDRAFNWCSKLTTLILRNTKSRVGVGTDTFKGTPLVEGEGHVYVPSALMESYKSYGSISAVLRALEDYTVDGTVTGELDETKI